MTDKVDTTKIYHKHLARLDAWNIVLDDLAQYSDRLDDRECIDILLVTNILKRHLEAILNGA